MKSPFLIHQRTEMNSRKSFFLELKIKILYRAVKPLREVSKVPCFEVRSLENISILFFNKKINIRIIRKFAFQTLHYDQQLPI